MLLNISRQYNVSDVTLRPDLFRDYIEIQSDSAFYSTVTEIKIPDVNVPSNTPIGIFCI